MLIHNQLWEQGVVGSNPAIPTKTKESTGIQKPVLFLCGTRTRDPGPLRGQQQNPQEFAAGG